VLRTAPKCVIHDIMRLGSILLLFILASGCSIDSGCANTILEAKPDLSGDLIAYRYLRDCGATTDYVSNVAIGRRGESPGEARVIFTADSNHGDADIEGKSIWMEMRWTAPHKLSIAYAEKARVFRAERSFPGAEIVLRATGRNVFPEPPPTAI
jgi:hypothetical protein